MNLLSQDEIKHAKKFANGEWSLLSSDSESGLEVYMRRDGNNIHFLEAQLNIGEIIAANKDQANNWSGWQNKKHGAVVSRIPLTVYNDMVRECGYDGSEYDTNKFKKMMNDPDRKHLRTGGGVL
jgi:hypothetical protein